MGSIFYLAGRHSKIAVINRANEANSTCDGGRIVSVFFFLLSLRLRLLVAQCQWNVQRL